MERIVISYLSRRSSGPLVCSRSIFHVFFAPKSRAEILKIRDHRRCNSHSGRLVFKWIVKSGSFEYMLRRKYGFSGRIYASGLGTGEKFFPQCVRMLRKVCFRVAVYVYGMYSGRSSDPCESDRKPIYYSLSILLGGYLHHHDFPFSASTVFCVPFPFVESESSETRPNRAR